MAGGIHNVRQLLCVYLLIDRLRHLSLGLPRVWADPELALYTRLDNYNHELPGGPAGPALPAAAIMDAAAAAVGPGAADQRAVKAAAAVPVAAVSSQLMSLLQGGQLEDLERRC